MGRYVDIKAIMQVIGCIYKNPSLLDLDDKYKFQEYDFTEDFHKILFGTIYNLHSLGAKAININTIEDYLAQRPKHLAVYKTYKGAEYLESISQTTQLSTFDYYYNRMKKMSLLRAYQDAGINLSWMYDIDNILDGKKKQAQENWIDSHSLDEIAEEVDKKISDIKLNYVSGTDNDIVSAGKGILELVDQLQKTPEFGSPLYGPLINTITRGARLGKFYLRSAATGIGKTRSMVADICNLACNEIFDPIENKWVKNGICEPALFITTEQEIDEIQTMMLAFLSNVNEEHIIYNSYYANELERVVYAGKLLNKCPIYIERLPDFSMQDIENTIKKAIRDYDVKYVAFDYIHSSMKILSEISSKANVKGLREDNILFMISTRLKDICIQYDIFILTATQLNSDYRSATQYDQNLLRGAKSIADKIDTGMIMLEPSQDDLATLEPILNKGGFEHPSIKMSIYKNRRGHYKDILLWCKSDRGTCRIEPMFATNYQYELLAIEDLKINVTDEKENKS